MRYAWRTVWITMTLLTFIMGEDQIFRIFISRNARLPEKTSGKKRLGFCTDTAELLWLVSGNGKTAVWNIKRTWYSCYGNGARSWRHVSCSSGRLQAASAGQEYLTGRVGAPVCNESPSCTAHCPQGLDIPSYMRKMSAVWWSMWTRRQKRKKAKRAMCSLIKIQTAHRFREMQIFWHIWMYNTYTSDINHSTVAGS